MSYTGHSTSPGASHGFTATWGVIAKASDNAIGPAITNSTSTYLPEAVVIAGALILAAILNAARAELRLRQGRTSKHRSR